MSTQADIDKAAADSKEAAGIMKAFAKGDAETQVDNGLPDGIPSLAKFIAEKDTEFQAALPDMVDEATDRAETAATNAEASASRIDLGALDDAVAATAADVVSTGSNATATAADRVQTGIDRVAADASAVAAAVSADAAQNTKGIFPTTANALSKGVVSLTGLTAGSGGTNGTFALAFSGGAGSKAAGWFVVSGGAVTSYGMSYPGYDYTSAPTVSFAASSGLTGASLTAVISQNVTDGQYFNIPDSADSGVVQLWQNVSGTATDTGKRTLSASLGKEIGTRVVSSGLPNEPLISMVDEHGYERELLALDGIHADGELLELDTVIIRQIDSGLAPLFEVGDESGYFPISIAAGDSLTGTKQIQADIKALKDSPSSGFAKPRSPNIITIAHRGTIAFGAPENSLDSLRHAAEIGYRYAETDMQRTSDGVFVIMHDPTINRTCKMASDYSTIPNPVYVKDTTLADLRSLYVLASGNEAYRQPIPTVEEYCYTAMHSGIIPFLEIKLEIDGITGTFEPIIDDILSVVVPILGWDRVAFNGFGISQHDYIRTKNANVKLLYTYDSLTSTAIDRVAAGKGILGCTFASITPELMAEAHIKGVPINSRTAVPANSNGMVDASVDYAMSGGEVASLSMAPNLDDQAVAFAADTSLNWDGFISTGTLTDDAMIMSSADTIQLINSIAPTIGRGAWYVTFDYKGSVTVTSENLPATEIENNSDFYKPASFSGLFGLAKPSLILTATSSSAIRNLSFCAIRA